MEKVHPVGLPTALPPGLVRVNLLSARRGRGLAVNVAGDRNILPPQLAYIAILRPERSHVVGHVIYHEGFRTLVFNIVPGYLGAWEGLPVVLKLTDLLFYNVSSGQVLEFEGDLSSCEIHQARRISGYAATRLYRMMEEVISQDGGRFDKLFPPDPVPRSSKVKTAEGQTIKVKGGR